MTPATWRATRVDGRVIRSLTLGNGHGRPHVVAVPGLGARGYLQPWLRAMAAGARVTLLDVPGWWWGRAAQLAAAAPDGAARVLPGAHNGCFRYPDAWAAAVRDVLAR